MAAHEARKADADRQRAKVLREIVKAKDYGITVDELSAYWGVPPNQISGRFSELKRSGDIEKIGTRPTRGGKSAGVCRAVKRKEGQQRLF